MSKDSPFPPVIFNRFPYFVSANSVHSIEHLKLFLLSYLTAWTVSLGKPENILILNETPKTRANGTGGTGGSGEGGS